MADKLLGDRDLAKLLLRAEREEEQAFYDLEGNGYAKEAQILREALRTNNMREVGARLTDMGSFLDVKEARQIRSKIEESNYIHQLVDKIVKYNQAVEKEETKQYLTSSDKSYLRPQYREGLSRGVDALNKKYPGFFEGEQTDEETKDVLEKRAQREALPKEEKETEFNMRAENKIPSQVLDETLQDKTRTVKDWSLETDEFSVNMQEKDPTTLDKMNYSQQVENTTSSDTNSQRYTYNAEEGLSEAPEQSMNITEDYSAKLEEGTVTFESSEGTRYTQPEDKHPERWTEVQRKKQAEREKQEAEEAAQDRKTFNEEAEEVFGAGGNEQFADPKGIDWAAMRKEAIWDPLQKAASEKTVADMAFSVFLAAVVDAPFKSINNLVKQAKANKKEDKKKLKENRDAAIDSNLKQRNLNRNDLITDLAQRAKRWILDDKVVQNIPEGAALTKFQKAHLKKYQFAQKLPRLPDGDLDFSKFSNGQLRKYQDYVVTYATLPEWRNRAQSLMGVRLSKDDLDKQISVATQMQIRTPNLAKDKDRLEDIKKGTVLASFPKTPEGDLDFSRFTTDQFQEYQSIIHGENQKLNNKTESNLTDKENIVSQPLIKQSSAEKEGEGQQSEKETHNKPKVHFDIPEDISDMSESELTELEPVSVSGPLKKPVLTFDGQGRPVNNEAYDASKLHTEMIARKKKLLLEQAAQQRMQEKALENARKENQQGRSGTDRTHLNDRNARG